MVIGTNILPVTVAFQQRGVVRQQQPHVQCTFCEGRFTQATCWDGKLNMSPPLKNSFTRHVQTKPRPVVGSSSVYHQIIPLSSVRKSRDVMVWVYRHLQTNVFCWQFSQACLIIEPCYSQIAFKLDVGCFLWPENPIVNPPPVSSGVLVIIYLPWLLSGGHTFHYTWWVCKITAAMYHM